MKKLYTITKDSETHQKLLDLEEQALSIHRKHPVKLHEMIRRFFYTPDNLTDHKFVKDAARGRYRAFNTLFKKQENTILFIDTDSVTADRDVEAITLETLKERNGIKNLLFQVVDTPKVIQHMGTAKQLDGTPLPINLLVDGSVYLPLPDDRAPGQALEITFNAVASDMGKFELYNLLGEASNGLITLRRALDILGRNKPATWYEATVSIPSSLGFDEVLQLNSMEYGEIMHLFYFLDQLDKGKVDFSCLGLEDYVHEDFLDNLAKLT